MLDNISAINLFLKVFFSQFIRMLCIFNFNINGFYKLEFPKLQSHIFSHEKIGAQRSDLSNVTQLVSSRTQNSGARDLGLLSLNLSTISSHYNYSNEHPYMQ